ncbi:MAG: hypothetical protein F4Y27_06230 [Acidimicrobiaceae bacterium]|nr:hypothetical protein [Acidimicrobiaceae bacterium]MXW60927.1 hypothetical protein [Acidimicrobiaceae bacterium]MXW75016.1 hypothetical protein [Acidimicrobiaceae bacterium]MYA74255.1 hypothetical protein [Acidimicrobiaceae bacterium]MYC42546.1 hypothetical protein [Acidimicrobiaceae bacterium]
MSDQTVSEKTTSEHPVATAQQHSHELAALELIAHRTVTEAYKRVADHWLKLAEPSEVMRECFDWAFREVMFSAAVWSSNQDPLRPKVTCITRLAHTVEGHEIPGSRWGIDNPDSIYRVIPISGDEKYRISGRVGRNRMTENYFTLWDDKMGTVDVLNGRTMEVSADGSFEITVDSSPAQGRPNHVQSAPEAHEFYIRDVMADWNLDDPNHFTIERLGSKPTTAAMSLDEQAQLTADFMLHYADFTRRMSRGTYRMPANHFALAWSADHTGALRNQVYVGGRFELAPDEAFVVTVSDGGAEYFTVPLSNIWGTTMDIVDRTASLNKAQSVPNPDGTYTYVLSDTDPGVHNWVDTCGLNEGILTLRMAEFPQGGPREDLAAAGEVVKLDHLDSALPEGTAFVDAETRAAQLATRRAGYLRRLPEVAP